MSTWKRPAPAQLWRAIDLYIANSYDGPVPTAVRARLDSLRAAPPDDLFSSPVLERSEEGEKVLRYSLRLGNKFYPHMKLAIEPAPTGDSYLFRVDTHDRHVRLPPGSPEARALADLMAANQTAADKVDAAWEKEGLPTFKAFLRNDLARRAEESARGELGKRQASE